MDIKVKYIDRNLPPLSYSQKGDCIDLFVSGTHEFKKGDTVLLPLGVAMELPTNYRANIYPRSSTFKKYGLILANSVGIIDNSYKGDNDEWKALFYATKSGKVEHGSRLTQFEIVPVMDKMELKTTEWLNNNSRDGFGSTGI